MLIVESSLPGRVKDVLFHSGVDTVDKLLRLDRASFLLLAKTKGIGPSAMVDLCMFMREKQKPKALDAFEHLERKIDRVLRRQNINHLYMINILKIEELALEESCYE